MSSISANRGWLSGPASAGGAGCCWSFCAGGSRPSELAVAGGAGSSDVAPVCGAAVVVGDDSGGSWLRIGIRKDSWLSMGKALAAWSRSWRS